MPVDIGEPTVDTVLPKDQAFVIDAQQMQDCGVEVVAVGFSFGGLMRPTRFSVTIGATRITK